MSLAQCQVRFQEAKDKCFFSSSTSHIYVDQKDIAWLPLFQQFRHRQESTKNLSSAKSPFLTLGRMNHKGGRNIMVDPAAVLTKQRGVPGCKTSGVRLIPGPLCKTFLSLFASEFHVIHEINIPKSATS